MINLLDKKNWYWLLTLWGIPCDCGEDEPKSELKPDHFGLSLPPKINYFNIKINKT